MPAVRELIDEFLALKRIAVVGVSRNPKDFNTALFTELCRRGYDAVPVSPYATTVGGKPAFARVQDIQPPVDGALLMTTPAVTDRVVRDCAEAGIQSIWMYRATGKGAVSEDALEFCRQHGIRVVPGFCPHMFLPNAMFFHRFHGALLKITGRYPK
jgi:uncharacterized protein